jgi:Maltose acetyltransferase.
MRSQKDRMLAGDLYIADDPELAKDFHKAKRLLREYNQTTEYQEADRKQILGDLFKQSGQKDSYRTAISH